MVLLTLLSARFVAVLSTLISTTVIILVILGWLYALRCTHGLYLWYFGELPLSKTGEKQRPNI
jgi:type IV secretory pathway TrbD component